MINFDHDEEHLRAWAIEQAALFREGHKYSDPERIVEFVMGKQPKTVAAE